jgi:hypothetical protein
LQGNLEVLEVNFIPLALPGHNNGIYKKFTIILVGDKYALLLHVKALTVENPDFEKAIDKKL